jgi:hypothetical protein
MDTNKSALVERCLACEARRDRNRGRLKKREGIRKVTHASPITSVGVLARAEVGFGSEATLHGSDRTNPFMVRLARPFLPDRSRW